MINMPCLEKPLNWELLQYSINRSPRANKNTEKVQKHPERQTQTTLPSAIREIRNIPGCRNTYEKQPQRNLKEYPQSISASHGSPQRRDVVPSMPASSSSVHSLCPHISTSHPSTSMNVADVKGNQPENQPGSPLSRCHLPNSAICLLVHGW